MHQYENISHTTNSTTKSRYGPRVLDIKHVGLEGTGLITTPLNRISNLSEVNVSHGGIALRGPLRIRNIYKDFLTLHNWLYLHKLSSRIKL